jgi:hypothetical protein
MPGNHIRFGKEVFVMYSVTNLNIVGYQGQPVPNTFFLQDFETRHVAILFPGYAYNASMPALYYPGRLMLARGADLLRVEYAYNLHAEFPTLPGDDRACWLAEDVTSATNVTLAQRDYQQITLIGKSIGTLAMGYLLATVSRLRDARCVWLTPLLSDANLLAQIKESSNRSLFVIGTADRYYDPQTWNDLVQATGAQSLIIEGADHSLEIPDDTMASLHAMERVVRAMDRFFG